MNLYLTVRVFSVAISSTPNYLSDRFIHGEGIRNLGSGG